ncbi:uncharacterized protein [Paramisgurnus dabryanus]|uniref:uncharacterized protein n=1 Tax=Paramisgurnus dabryanus TaxID=90735 RepID=UPI003CCF2E80
MNCYLLKKMSDVILFCLCLWSLMGVFGESVSVTEGDSVTLFVNLSEIQRKEGITWKFGPQYITIAEIEVEDNKISVYDKERADGRFRDRLKLDHSGSLTITNTRTTDSGLYQLINTSTNNQLNIFNITVYARLPVPVISRVSSKSSSSSSSSICSLLCSVLNVRDVSLSWYKGNSLLSSISVSDLNNIISISLMCLDDSYSCVVNNSISNQTQHLNTDLCHTYSDKMYCCFGFIEVVIQLVVSVLVGVAAVGFVVYDIRSRRDEEKRMRSDKPQDQTSKGDWRGTTGTPQARTSASSMKLPSAPESRRAVDGWSRPAKDNMTGSWVLEAGESFEEVAPTRTPVFTDGQRPFNGQVLAKCPDLPQYKHSAFCKRLSLSLCDRRMRPSCMGSDTAEGEDDEEGEVVVLSENARWRMERRCSRSNLRASIRRARSIMASNEGGRSWTAISSWRSPDNPSTNCARRAASFQWQAAARVLNSMALSWVASALSWSKREERSDIRADKSSTSAGSILASSSCEERQIQGSQRRGDNTGETGSMETLRERLRVGNTHGRRTSTRTSKLLREEILAGYRERERGSQSFQQSLCWTAHSGSPSLTQNYAPESALLLDSARGVFGEFVSVMEGDPVTLSVSLTETQIKEGISWKFGPEITIAEIEVGGKYINLYEERADGRFRDRLKLDHSGSLTITNIRITDSGLYQLINTNKKTQLNIFNLTVYARLPVPVISRVSSQSSSSSSSICSLLCSVLNVRDVSLSWYKGNSLLSIISVSDLNISSISLHLKCLDDSYSCVVNNSISNQTQHLNTDLCHTYSEEICCCFSFTEVVIGLVFSVLVGVAAVGLVVYDIRSRRDEEKRMRSDKPH